MPDTIQIGAGLLEGERLTSNNQANHLVMQSDGNLAFYGYALVQAGNATWSSKTNTKNPAEPYRLLMQDDGNLVVYDGHKDSVWGFNTNLKGDSPHRLAVQDDGNLVLYDAHYNPTWASNTNH